MIKNRLTEIDVIKGIGIILVVFAHCIQCGSGSEYYDSLMFFDNVLFRIIYSFHMPLLMLVSGYLLASTIEKRTFKEIVIRRFQQLAVPIFTWNLLVVSRHLLSASIVVVIKEWFMASINGFWFLWAVFLCSVYVALVYKKFNNNKWLYVLGMGLTLITPDVLNSECYKYMYVFFLIGFLANQYNWKDILVKSSPFKMLIIFVIYVILLVCWENKVYIYIGGWSCLKDSFSQAMITLMFNLYRSVIGICGSLLIVWFICNYRKNIKSTVINGLSYLGRKSMGIYIISTYANVVLQKVTQGMQYHVIITLMETVGIVSGCVFVIQIIHKNSFVSRLLLGEVSSKK